MRFATPEGWQPERWTLRRIGPGRYIIVGEDGYAVFEHPDREVRRRNLHWAKASPMWAFTLARVFQFIENLALPLWTGWVLDLIADALDWGTPPRPSPSTSPVELPAEVALGQEVTETDLRRAA